MEESNNIIIGIDHGNTSIKTILGLNVSQVLLFSTMSLLLRGLLNYQSKYYSIGTERLPVKMDKQKMRTFIITLAAIAESLSYGSEYISTIEKILHFQLDCLS